jgi:hypothetical protein
VENRFPDKIGLKTKKPRSGIFLQTYPQNQFTPEGMWKVAQAFHFVILRYASGESEGHRKSRDASRKQIADRGAYAKSEMGLSASLD